MTGQVRGRSRRPTHQSAWPRDPREHARGRAEVARLGRPGLGVGQSHRQGDRRHLGRGAVPVRRHRRLLGRGAAPHRRAARRHFTTLSTPVQPDAPLRERVGTIIETLYHGLASADSRAIENLRAALPRDPDELERLYPRTAAELFSWGKSWLETCQNAFAGLDVDPDRVREVAALIPGAMRGLVSERQLGSYADLDMARRGLTNALVAYLENSGVK